MNYNIVWKLNEDANRKIDTSKRYWLFTWADYEAEGGFEDFRGSFDTIEEITAIVRDLAVCIHVEGHFFCVENGAIFDRELNKIVAEFEGTSI